MSIDDRHRDRNGELSRKHGNTLVGTLRKMYGARISSGPRLLLGKNFQASYSPGVERNNTQFEEETWR